MLNFNEAFKFPFKDPEWIQKLLRGTLFTLLSIFILPIPVVYGYLIELIKRVSNNEKYPLPDWKDPGVKFLRGFKYLIVMLIYYLPLILIVIFLLMIGFIFELTSNRLAFTTTLFIPLFGPVMVIALYSVVLYFLTPLITIEYSVNERIPDGLKINQILRYCKFKWKVLLIIGLVAFGLEIAASFGIIFLIVGILFTSFYVSLVTFHLYGQLGRDLKKITKN